MSIDIGGGAIDRAAQGSFAAYTLVDYNNPANATGRITSFEFWYTGTGGTGVVVGTFYGSGTSWTSRDSETIGSVSAGSKQTFSGLNCSVSTDDCIGAYETSGSLDYGANTSNGRGLYVGNAFGAGAQTYSNVANVVFSFYGSGIEDQILLPGGIASATAFGTSKLNSKLLPSGIGTEEAMGSSKLNSKLLPSGLISSESIGNQTLKYNLLIIPDGILSAEALGNSKLILFLLPSSIDSAEAVGDPGLSATITPSAILTAEIVSEPVLGFYRIAGSVTLLGSGVAGAIIRAINQVTGEVSETMTDINGNYNMALQVGDKHHVVVEYENGQKYNALSKWDVVPV